MSASSPTCPSSEILEGIALGATSDLAIQSHLADCDHCRLSLQKMRDDNRFLTSFAVNGALPSAEKTQRPDVQLQIPGYQLVRELHRGGQGVLYLALQKSTHREVAIKVMKQGPFATLADRARFDREVETLGKLDHPNIVAVHDAGVASGSHYFVMHYVAGQPLDEAAAQTGLDENIGSFIKVCDAVHDAHLRGIIHRDLKPSNIRVDPTGEPHVLDFGLAKSVDSPGDMEVTQTGQFVGSLPWASPEQVQGLSSKIDLRTDVYSLGVILYQIVSGAHPFPLDGSMAEMVRNIIEIEPSPPSTVRPDIDYELDTIVLKAISKDPARRYQSAGDFAHDLRRYLADDPIEARRDSTWYIIRKTAWRKRRVLLALLVPAILLPIAGIALYRGAAADRHAAQERKLREIEAGRNAAMLEITRRVQARAGSRADSPGGQLSILNADAIRTDLDTGGLAVSDYGVAMLLAETLRDRGLFESIVEAEGLVRQAIFLLSRDHGPKHPEIGKLRTVLADILLRRQTRMPDAEATAALAVQELTDAFGPSSPEAARAKIMLARVKLARGDYAGAMSAATSALASDTAPRSTHLIEAQAAIASIHAQKGERDQARRAFLDSIRAMLRFAHDTDSRLLDLLDLGASMIERDVLPAGEMFDPATLRGALATMKPAAALREVADMLRGGADGTPRDENYIPARYAMIALRERLLGPNDPTLGASLTSAASSLLADIWRELRRYTAQGRAPEFPLHETDSLEAVALLRRAIPLQISAHGPDSVIVGKCYNLLATGLLETVHMREATEWFARDCEVWTRQPLQLRDDHQIMLRTRWTAWHAVRAALCFPDPIPTPAKPALHSVEARVAPEVVDQYRFALTWSDLAIERVTRTVGPDHPAAAMMIACRTLCLAALGRDAESRAAERTALDILDKQPVPEDQRNESHRFIGMARLFSGRLDEARTMLEAGRKIAETKYNNPLTLLEWSRAMQICCRRIGDFERAKTFEDYIRQHGTGDITLK